MKNSKYVQAIALLGGALLIGLMYISYAVVMKTAPSPTPSAEPTATAPFGTPQQMTLTGTHVCLPHKDTTGPQTLECALGLHADNGKYYALDFSLSSQTPPDIATGDRITAQGVFRPIERLSTDHWQKYPIVGIFSVTQFEVISE